MLMPLGSRMMRLPSRSSFIVGLRNPERARPPHGSHRTRSPGGDHAGIKVRMRCERGIVEAGLNATVLRPWYVLGPSHRWPYAIIPFYKLADRVQTTRHASVRLGLVTIGEMATTLVYAVENPVSGQRVLQPPEIRALGSTQSRRNTRESTC